MGCLSKREREGTREIPPLFKFSSGSRDRFSAFSRETSPRVQVLVRVSGIRRFPALSALRRLPPGGLAAGGSAVSLRGVTWRPPPSVAGAALTVGPPSRGIRVRESTPGSDQSGAAPPAFRPIRSRRPRHFDQSRTSPPEFRPIRTLPSGVSTNQDGQSPPTPPRENPEEKRTDGGGGGPRTASRTPPPGANPRQTPGKPQAKPSSPDAEQRSLAGGGGDPRTSPEVTQ